MLTARTDPSALLTEEAGANRRLLSVSLGLAALGVGLFAQTLHAEEGAARAVTGGDVTVRVDGGPRVFVPGGHVSLGSDDGALRRAINMCLSELSDAEGLRCPPELFMDETPRKRVLISPFLMDRFEVSRARYAACVRAGVCVPAQGRDQRDARLPVTGVTFDDASRFCAFVGGRLPTEAEWERAARGNDARAFPWGDAFHEMLCNHASSARRPAEADGYDGLAPVDSFREGQSPYGVVNMAGNAWEWTRDYYQPSYGETALVDPLGPSEGTTRVLRGGSYRSEPYSVRVSRRMPAPAEAAHPDVGFRCVYEHD